ncbi:MAG: hypothetical protein ABSG69_12180 [Candidatus Acidiferrum sp.]
MQRPPGEAIPIAQTLHGQADQQLQKQQPEREGREPQASHAGARHVPGGHGNPSVP